MSGSNEITAIVSACRRPEQTLTTLSRLRDCHPAPDEILVHVDGNQTDCARAIRDAFPEINVILSQTAIGPGGGRNRLIAAARNDIVASFDDDSYPLDMDYFKRLAVVFARYPEAGVVAALVYERGIPVEPVETNADWVADFVGCGCAYRRELFLRTGGYVPLPMAYGMEEADFALRLHALGGRVTRSYELRVFHDTDLAHHASASVTAASLSNLVLLAYLRYPLWLWGLGFAQVVNRVWWLLRHGRRFGILAGLVRIPRSVRQCRNHRATIRAKMVVSYLRLRRNPVSAEPVESFVAAGETC